MDEVDLRIIRHMGWRPFDHGARGPDAVRPASLSRRIGLGLDATKERIGRMESQGVIQGYEVEPNLRLLGLRRTTLHCLAGGRKAEAVRQLQDLDGAACVYDFMGPDLCVDIVHRTDDELERRKRILASLAGASKALRLYETPTPPVHAAPGPLGWRILRALRGQALRRLEDVAEELGVSARTVKRHFEAMVKGGCLDVVPKLDFGRMEGLMATAFVFFYDAAKGPATEADIEKAFDPRWMYSWKPASSELGNFELVVWARSNAEVARLRDAAEAIPGIDRVLHLQPTGAWPQSAWLDSALQQAELSESTSA